MAEVAFRAGTLSRSGALAAAAVGAAVLSGTGWWGGLLLLTFFVGSTAISRWAPDPAALAGEVKGGHRDLGQVLANGGAPALGALLGLASSEAGIWLLSMGLAAAAADTWATAVGGTSPRPPRHILTGRPVAAGTSGGVTLRGTLGGLFGAATIAGMAWIVTHTKALAGWALVIGTGGMLLDSLLGALLQGRFHCPTCDLPTERARHRCGTPTTPVGGIRWLTNDGVNAIATLTATLLAWWLWARAR